MTDRRTTTVKSELAKRDARDAEGDRCQSTLVIRQAGWGLAAGQTVKCERPASGHRVHEALGYVQWGGK